MATRQELNTLFKAAMAPADPSKFSAADANSAAVNAILETFGLEGASARQIRAHQAEIFAMIEEVIEEQLPAQISEVMGGFTEVKNYARDAEPVFEVKGIGKRRARMGITEGARGGVYKAKRLDSKTFTVSVKTWTVKVFVTLEDILLGNYTLADLMANIRDGFVEKIYTAAVQALRTAKTLAPAANIAEGNGFVEKTVDDLIAIARQYGDAVIMGFRPAISKIMNISGYAADADKNDIRNRGFVSIYKGIPVVELPNYLVDETNAAWVFKNGDLFILPTASKPVKVAMKGDLTIVETAHPSGSVEQNAHRLVGVGLTLVNDVCVYTDLDITDTNANY